MQSNQKIFCVDIGGTKTAMAFYDGQGNELFYDYFPTYPEQGAERLIERVYDRVKGELQGTVIGSLASPGPLDIPQGRIVSIATMGWKDVPIVQMFEEKTGIPFRLLNDCDAGALGVWQFVAQRTHGTLCYMSISTGIGGGIVLDGKLHTGGGNAANFGHIPVAKEGLSCGCGREDCLELYASGSGMERRYFERTGEPLSCAQIAQRAREGEEAACEIFQTATQKLILALGAIVACVDPDVIVLGGSVCKSGDLFLEALQKAYPSLSFLLAPQSGKQVLQGAWVAAKEFIKNQE